MLFDFHTCIVQFYGISKILKNLAEILKLCQVNLLIVFYVLDHRLLLYQIL